MKKEMELLNFVFKNAEMGIIGIDDLLEILEDNKFSEMLKVQREEYSRITSKARGLINEYGMEVEENSNITKVRSNLMIKLSGLKDKSIKKFAKMMIEGTNKGIIEIQEKINAYKNENNDVLDLANELLEVEENNIEELKEYL